MRRLVTGLALLCALAVISGCVPTGPDAEACAEPAVELSLTLTEDGLEPGNPAVCRDQEVTLNVASELDGVLHIHGYDSEVPAFMVAAGETEEVTFSAGRSGQFAVEFHPADDPTGIAVGVFTVHEP